MEGRRGGRGTGGGGGGGGRQGMEGGRGRRESRKGRLGGGGERGQDQVMFSAVRGVEAAGPAAHHHHFHHQHTHATGGAHTLRRHHHHRHCHYHIYRQTEESEHHTTRSFGFYCLVAAKCHKMRWRPLWITLVALLTLMSATMASQTIGTGKRGQLSGRYKGRKNFKPITGTYPSVEARNYYTNPKGAKITKASHFNYQYVLGHKIAFLCVAKGIPLPQITWFKDGVELYAHRYMQLHEWKKGNKLKSKMEIDPATQADAGIYECHANNKYAVDTKAFRTTYIAQFN